MALRPQISKTPGPAKYGVPDVNVTKKKAPQYTIGAKWTAAKCARASPAPNRYQPATNNVGDRAPMYTMSGRHAEPGRYGRRAAFATPGPARYAAVEVASFKELRAPRPVMLGRHAEPDVNRRTPAPNKYSPSPAKAPAFSLGGRRWADPFLTAADRVPDWEQQQ